MRLCARQTHYLLTKELPPNSNTSQLRAGLQTVLDSHPATPDSSQEKPLMERLVDLLAAASFKLSFSDIKNSKFDVLVLGKLIIICKYIYIYL